MADWDEIEAMPQEIGKAVPMTMAEVADRSAANIAKAQDLKEETSKCSKAIHAFGGEQAVWDALGGGMTVLGLAETLKVSTAALDRWVQRGGEARRDAYARARVRGGQSLAEQAIQIADEIEVESENGRINKAKLRIDQRWRMASKVDPDSFGDRQAQININLGDIALSALRKREVIDVEDVRPVNGLDDDGIQ